MLVRIPVIPNHNDSSEYLEKCSELLADCGVKKVELLPFHRLGSGKYDAIGKEYEYEKYLPYSKKDMEKLKGNEVYYLREFARLDSIKAGKVKKPHYHMMVKFDTLKSRQQVVDTFCLPLNANMFPQIAQSERGSVRYLIHMDNPGKPLYRLDEIRLFNGYDPEDYFDLSNAELCKIPSAVQEYIELENICSYAELCELCRIYAPWYKYVISNTYFLSNYIDSRVKALRKPAEELEIKKQQLLEHCKYLELLNKQNREQASKREAEPVA